jgi:hypothetical protein
VNLTELREYLADDDQPCTFYHNDVEQRDGREIDLALLGTALWYHTCDFRPARRFRPVAHSTFVRDATRAAQKRDLFHGIRSNSILLDVPFIDIETDLCFEGFHPLYNTVKNLLMSMKGDRADSLGVRRYCAYTGTHYPYLHNAGGIPPWQRIETQQWRLDAHTNSVMIPMGYKKKFMVKNPFQQSGNLRGTDYLTFATVLMDYIEFISDFPPAYKLFYRMFGHDMTDLLAPFFSDKDIDD